MRTPGRWLFVLLALLAVAAPLRSADAPAPAPEASGGQEPPGAVDAIRAELEIERTLLREDRARNDQLSQERIKSDADLDQAYKDLDAAVRREDVSAPDAIADVTSRLESAEKQRSELLTTERLVVESIRNRMRRIALLEDRLHALQARTAETTGPLSGSWDVVLLPINQRGTFQLTQNGTLVQGSYTLEGGWTGNLRGTFVNRKLFLERIDSRLGRSAEFEGYLSTDGSRIRGTWLNYDLTAEGGSNGQWSATRSQR